MNTSKLKLDFTPTLRKVHKNVQAKNIHGDLVFAGFVKRMTDDRRGKVEWRMRLDMIGTDRDSSG